MSRVELYREKQSLDKWAAEFETGPRLPALGKWRWRYVSNGHIMADSGQGYSRRIDCLNGCARVLNGRFHCPNWLKEYGGVTPDGVIGYVYQYRADEGLDDWSRAGIEHVPPRASLLVVDLTKRGAS